MLRFAAANGRREAVKMSVNATVDPIGYVRNPRAVGLRNKNLKGCHQEAWTFTKLAGVQGQPVDTSASRHGSIVSRDGPVTFRNVRQFKTLFGVP